MYPFFFSVKRLFCIQYKQLSKLSNMFTQANFYLKQQDTISQEKKTPQNIQFSDAIKIQYF